MTTPKNICAAHAPEQHANYGPATIATENICG